jgi:hypothetical protein
VLLSVSRLDYTKGILHQLQAVDGLLALNPGRRDLVYKLVVAPSREDLAEYQAERLASAALAEEVNQTYGDTDWQPVEFEYRNYGFDELAAWYRRADIMLVTPLIDGMNLVAKEYVAAHDDEGMLVLGQGAGAAMQLRDAVIVDPRNIAGATLALQSAWYAGWRAASTDASHARECTARKRACLGQRVFGGVSALKNHLAGGFLESTSFPCPRCTSWAVRGNLSKVAFISRLLLYHFSLR